MSADATTAKTPATLDEIWTRVYCALARHRLCRNIEFDVVGTPRNARGGNWAFSMTSVTPDAIWEASDIVADIQAAYDLVADPHLTASLAAAA